LEQLADVQVQHQLFYEIQQHPVDRQPVEYDRICPGRLELMIFSFYAETGWSSVGSETEKTAATASQQGVWPRKPNLSASLGSEVLIRQAKS
jgi:hypothetical protein